jgi:hypothetical protein
VGPTVVPPTVTPLLTATPISGFEPTPTRAGSQP